jgi:hypothetical protein
MGSEKIVSSYPELIFEFPLLYFISFTANHFYSNAKFSQSFSAHNSSIYQNRIRTIYTCESNTSTIVCNIMQQQVNKYDPKNAK